MPPKRSTRLKPKNPEPIEVIVDIKNREPKKKKEAAKKKNEKDTLEDIREVFRQEQEEFNRKQEEKLEKALKTLQLPRILFLITKVLHLVQ